MALSKTTQDHDEIKAWAEKRGAIPSEVASTEKNGEPGILRLQFPQAKNANDSALKEIGWDDFFEKFDRSGLSLVYQDVTSEGAESNFNKLIHPESASPSKNEGGKTVSKKSGSKTSKAAPTPVERAVSKAAVRPSAAEKAPAKRVTSKKSAIKTPAKKAVKSAHKR